jgi:hypothetical protein
MKKEEARQRILQEWHALPEAQRRTEHQAVVFVMKALQRYPFRGWGDPYQTIKAWLMPTLGLVQSRAKGRE